VADLELGLIIRVTVGLPDQGGHEAGFIEHLIEQQLDASNSMSSMLTNITPSSVNKSRDLKTFV
jgi:hypothetical protein